MILGIRHVVLSAAACVVAGVSGCRDTNTRAEARLTVPAEILPAGLPVDSLRPVIMADSALLKQPTALAASSQFVVVADNRTDSLFALFDTRSFQFAGAIGTRTPTPDAPLFAGPVGFASGGAQFQMLDALTRRVATYGIGDSASTRNLVMVDSTAGLTEIYPLSKGQFLGVGLTVNGRFGTFDSAGRLQRALGTAPSQPDTAPLYVRQHAHRTVGTLSPAKDRLALLGKYGDALEILDTRGHVIARGERPVKFDPQYVVAKRRGFPNVALIPDTRIAYVAATSDNDHIYALFSGRAVGAAGAKAFRGRRVVVFDWDGRLQRMLQLEQDASAIAISPDGAWLFAIRVRPTASLVRYPIARATTTRTVATRAKP